MIVIGDYKTCKVCGYQEKHEILSDERGDYTKAGSQGDFINLGNGQYACPCCKTVKYYKGK
ncbi:MAG: hypothetical protein ACOCRK_11560 [bacterium]